ncbi:hypothetical protein [Halococcus saccharolyticus]|uniref:Uncharacterized protein n=1 Tax=Halococcus saccharolyticus DSM 5350 TaxID=1227455 RepID=M0MPI7_9EURY|nr:hypothetical protein [Halococcus saccharolyticus]EMA47617.1 hypothetical protein C449_01102 [Halococcus saccharolyticus DSM 5350]
MTEIEITLWKEQRTMEDRAHPKAPDIELPPLWVAETKQYSYPQCKGRTPRDCLMDIGAMVNQAVQGQSGHDRDEKSAAEQLAEETGEPVEKFQIDDETIEEAPDLTDLRGELSGSDSRHEECPFCEEQKSHDMGHHIWTTHREELERAVEIKAVHEAANDE